MAKTVGMGAKVKKNDAQNKEMKALKEELMAVQKENAALKEELMAVQKDAEK